MAPSQSGIGFGGGSTDLCLSYYFSTDAALRIEARHFFSASDQFMTANGTFTRSMNWLITGLTFSL